MVPHVAARKTHQRLLKFSFVTPKRLLQQYLPIADSCAAAKLSVRTSPGGWRSPERLLEGAGKSGLGTVTDQVGNLREGRTGIAEFLGRDLHAPTGDVVHRRHADQTNEALGQRRTRQADLTAKVIHIPRPGNVAMEQRQRPRYVGIAQTGEPTGLPL